MERGFLTPDAHNDNNNNHSSLGFQNAVLVDPSGQGVVNPFLGYQRGVYQPQVLRAPLTYPNRPYDLVYQDPGFVNG